MSHLKHLQLKQLLLNQFAIEAGAVETLALETNAVEAVAIGGASAVETLTPKHAGICFSQPDDATTSGIHSHTLTHCIT